MVEIVRILTAVVGCKLDLTMTQIAAGVPVLLYSVLVSVSEACTEEGKLDSVFLGGDNDWMGPLVLHAMRYFHNLFDAFGVEQVDAELRHFLYKFERLKLLRLVVP